MVDYHLYTTLTATGNSAQASRKKQVKHELPTPPGRAAPVPKPRTTSRPQAVNPAPDLFTSLGLHIYFWPIPRPLNFLNLADWHARWKEKQDDEEGMRDLDPDLDDWFVMSGNLLFYSSTNPQFSFTYSIARSFINRAKRAYRVGTSWIEYEDSELAIDSMSQVKEMKNPEYRALAEKEAVDNVHRLKTLMSIKERLCNEIWLEPYPADRYLLEFALDGEVIIMYHEQMTHDMMDTETEETGSCGFRQSVEDAVHKDKSTPWSRALEMPRGGVKAPANPPLSKYGDRMMELSVNGPPTPAQSDFDHDMPALNDPALMVAFTFSPGTNDVLDDGLHYE